MITRVASLALLLAGACLSVTGWTVQITEQCARDHLTSSLDVIGRNCWAAQCGLISEEQLLVAIDTGTYWTFDPGTAPVDDKDDCLDMKPSSLCPGPETQEKIAEGLRPPPAPILPTRRKHGLQMQQAPISD